MAYDNLGFIADQKPNIDDLPPPPPHDPTWDETTPITQDHQSSSSPESGRFIAGFCAAGFVSALALVMLFKYGIPAAVRYVAFLVKEYKSEINK